MVLYPTGSSSLLQLSLQLPMRTSMLVCRIHAVLSFAMVSVLIMQTAQAQDFGGRTDRGVISDAAVDESSGLCVSHRNSRVLWTHNDSGDKARIFAMNDSARVLGIYYLRGAANRDWEDMCSARIHDTAWIYVGEIGDNNAAYETKTIYCVAEPSVSASQGEVSDTLSVARSISFAYPDGKRDAECLMIDAQTEDLYVISKREDSVHVYRLPYPQRTDSLCAIELVAILPYTFITAGDISPDGSEILIKNYTTVYHFHREAGESIAQCLLRTPIQEPYEMEPQGEAIAFDPDGSGYYTTSENSAAKIPAHLYFYPRLNGSSAQTTKEEATLSLDSLRVDQEARVLDVYVHAKLATELTLQIVDMNGRSMLSTPHMAYNDGGQHIQLPLRSLRSGSYALRLLARNVMQTKLFQFSR